MTNLQYILYSIAAALMKAGESLKDSAENVPASIGFGAPDEDGVVEPNNSMPPAVDSAGIPHDPSIHAGTKSTKADGTWTRKKGVSDIDYNAGIARLKGTAAAVGLPAPGAVGGVQLPAIGGLPLPGSMTPPALTEYQKLVAYLAAKTGPGKAADDEWVGAAFAGWGLTLAGMATDEANSTLVLAEFKKVLGE